MNSRYVVIALEMSRFCYQSKSRSFTILFPAPNAEGVKNSPNTVQYVTLMPHLQWERNLSEALIGILLWDLTGAIVPEGI